MRLESELMRGAGPVAVLKLLERKEMYGYELADALATRSEGVLDMGQSTLYPLLYNLEAKGMIESDRRTADNGRERKYYRLTSKGRRRLAEDMDAWKRLVSAMSAIGVIGPASTLTPVPALAAAPTTFTREGGR